MKRHILTVASVLVILTCGTVATSGTLTVDGTAAKNGSNGLTVDVSGSGDKAWVEESDAHNLETVYRAEFWFNPNTDRDQVSGNFPAGNAFVIFQAISDDPDQAGIVPVVEVELRRYGSSSSTVRVRAYCYYDRVASGTIPGKPKRLATPMLALTPDDWHKLLVEIDTSSNNVTGSVDGVCRLSVIDGPVAPKSGELVGVVKNARSEIKLVRMGAVWGVDPTTTMALYFDDFASFRTLSP